MDDVADPAALADGIATDGTGNLFVAGSVKDAAGITHAVIQQNSNQGDPDSWTTADDVPGAQYRCIAAKDGVVVAAATQGGACLVRGRIDGEWGELGKFIHPNLNYSLQVIWDIELDDSNNIYVVTEYSEKVASLPDRRGKVTYTQVRRPILLKRENNTWLPPIATPTIKNVAISGSDIYATGGGWRVRKGSPSQVPGLLEWVTLEDINAQFDSNAVDIAMDANGQLFVCGWVARVEYATVNNKTVVRKPVSWMTRRGVYDGNWTWNIVDDLRIGTAPTQNCGLALTIDKSNNVWVTGLLGVDPQTSLAQWVTRRGSPVGNPGVWTWTTTDQLDPTSYDTHGSGIAVDPTTGNVFAAGGSLGNLNPQWKVRRLLIP